MFLSHYSSFWCAITKLANVCYSHAVTKFQLYKVTLEKVSKENVINREREKTMGFQHLFPRTSEFVFSIFARDSVHVIETWGALKNTHMLYSQQSGTEVSEEVSKLIHI